jgi:hypothetical protein
MKQQNNGSFMAISLVVFKILKQVDVKGSNTFYF